METLNVCEQMKVRWLNFSERWDKISFSSGLCVWEAATHGAATYDYLFLNVGDAMEKLDKCENNFIFPLSHWYVPSQQVKRSLD